MYLTLIFLTFISSCLAGLFGRHFGSLGSAYLATSCLFISLLISLFIFYETALIGCVTFIKLTTWINSEVLHIDWGFMFDALTACMCVVVTFISFLVHLYSIEYMSHDPHLPRFMSYLSLFTFFMLILVTADNFIQMFVGWEGVGLCSYLLINFWFTRIQANKAAIKAMIINRIGDFCLLFGMLLIFINFKSVDYNTVAALVPFFKNHYVVFLNINFNLLTLIGIFLFLGAVGKSAQIGLHTWLPDAMEGPTPVSALIHAATMVTAGIFLIARCSFIYEHIPNVLFYISIIGTITAFFASTTGLVQNDLKRVIAYSTCSQLGYMIFACGLSNYSVGIFHLTNHAFFKALLFLGAGSVIHAVNDEQDMRKMGGIKKLVPFTYSMMVIGSLALIGFPYLTGFYSKDLILEVAYGKYNIIGYFCYSLGSLGAFLTAFYSTRLLYLTFLSKPLGYKQIISFAKDSGLHISIALGCLSIPSIFVGYFIKDMLVGVGSSFFGTAIYSDVGQFNLFDAEFVTLFYKSLPVILSILGVLSAYMLYNYQSKLLFKTKQSYYGVKIYNFLNRKWFFDKLYNDYFGQLFFKFGYSISYKVIDRGIFEILGPTGLSTAILKLSSNFHKAQSGYLYHYTLSILLGLVILIQARQLIFIYNSINLCLVIITLLSGIYLVSKTFSKMLNAPLEQFQILSLIPIKLFQMDLSITNFFLINLLAIFSLITFVYCNSNFNISLKKTSLFFNPNSWQKSIESLSELTARLTSDIITSSSEKYFPFISVLFNFILLSNLIGLIPYSFTATSHLIVTFFLSFSVFIGINIITFSKYKMKAFSLFLPANTSFFLALLLVPIEFISYIAKPISLGVRLFINLMAGHSLLKVIVGFSWSMLLLENLTSFGLIVPLLILVLLFGLELGVALIQTYVFIILTCIYIQDGS